ncbi:dynein axonemal assembly factor 5 [Latimeria chalumnae]|uniref:Dynein axonemal assembly factor 5 n=1 Tax=Latimeria chalumnae TaxID=7897 RepID=H3B2F2_LATCH|nr:PREDICTED: dynein assembly factor 5, axonemal [Latimeria chalumnae]|eukprot:XP_005997023.1 PREDICTED: dynein assembly factor 5, axonemal [Latimeria chalumnae]
MATAMATEQCGVAEVSQALARHLNCLNDGNKSTRRRALEAIRRETVEKALSSAVLQEIFCGLLLKPLLRCLLDPGEKCRELAVQLLRQFVSSVPQPEEALPYLLPALSQRLGGLEIAEPAEELRLALVELLVLAVEVCGRHLAPYLEEMVKVLLRTIVDPFSDVKRESCRCAADYAKCIPEHFHMQSESLIKPLMKSISHQHSKVRVAVIQATGTVIQYGNGKSVDDVLSHFAQRLFDNAPQVRRAVTDVVGNWLLDLRDRYSYFHKLIPLLLSSFNDEIPEIRQLAGDYWKKIGQQWQEENEEDLKDKLDFSAPTPPLYPKGMERPGLGCRELIFRNLSKILPAVSRDMTDWVVETRIKASQLLTVLLLHAEDHITQHMALILTTLYHSCSDEETQVVKNCIESGKLVGCFVNPEVFMKMNLQALKSSASPPHLIILAAFIGGCNEDLLQPHLKNIANVLSYPDVCQVSERVVYMEQLLHCVQSLIAACGEHCREISLQLLQVLVTIVALTSDQELHDKALKTMGSLAEVQGLISVLDLYKQHITELLQWVSVTHQQWNSYSVQQLQFESILIQAGPIIGEVLQDLMPILRSCLEPRRDPEMRLKLFTVLSKLLLNANETVNSRGQFPDYLESIIKDVLIPNLLWHAGRTAAAIRTTAVTCLWALLHSQILSEGQALKVHNDLMPQVLSTLEEDSKLTRLVACRIVGAFLKLCGNQFSPDKLNAVYPELLKRLDDASDDVRVAAAKALHTWFQCINDDYERTTFHSHIEYLYRGLLVHLDDPDSNIQHTVLEVLQEGSVVCPFVLREEVNAVKHKHRSPFYCEQLLQHIDSAQNSTQHRKDGS